MTPNKPPAPIGMSYHDHCGHEVRYFLEAGFSVTLQVTRVCTDPWTVIGYRVIEDAVGDAPEIVEWFEIDWHRIVTYSVRGLTG